MDEAKLQMTPSLFQKLEGRSFEKWMECNEPANCINLVFQQNSACTRSVVRIDTCSTDIHIHQSILLPYVNFAKETVSYKFANSLNEMF